MMKDFENLSFKNNGKLKLLIIIGTRPEIIRLSAVITKCRNYFDCILAHTGQNYDYSLNGVFFHDLKLDDPDVYMDAVGDDLGSTIGNIINYSYNKYIYYSKLISDSNIILTKKSDKILLYNTHTSESYANSEKFTFEYTGTRRTTDANYNMLRIAKELNNNLNEKGFKSIQDTTPHDYGTYTSAYAKSRITLQNAISSYGGFGLAIDVHRDAIENLDFRPTVNIRGVEVARIMLVIGAGSRDNKNPYFEDNLKLALKLQYIGEKIYPGLFRTMYIRNSIYNQDLNRYSLLIEVGASGNSIEEAQMATRCITNLLNIIYKD